MFMFERSREPFLLDRRSREPCPTCLRSSGVENPALLVYVRAKSRTLTPCLCSSGVENLALLVYVRAESRTLFMFELSWHLVYVRAESRTLCYLFTFERSREPCAPCLCSSGVENLPDTMFKFERSREPCPTCLRSSGVENLVYVRAKSRTFLTPCLRSIGVENTLSNSPSK